MAASMSRRAATLAWLVAVGGCNQPSSYEDFRDKLARSSCDHDVRCGIVGASERPRCAVPPVLGTTSGTSGLDVPAGIKAGRLRFNGGGAQDCLDAMSSSPCDPVVQSGLLALHCHNVVQPGSSTGSPCLGSES